MPDGCLDGVVFECVLSALPGMAEALVEVRRVLVPGGRLLVTDLYRRDGAAGEPCADGSCAAGARTREAILDELFRAGLVPVLFEDHSRFLAELTGKLLFAGFSAADVGTALTGRTPGCACGLEALRPRLGYFLCVAVKEVS
ncbi:hypothetical protein ASZ90_000450 [hydrocarbon metagenome]|uniref:Methyltransferase type 11 domain-containing protein n=1 Tax=hydrocarbon metagenome TaxID=938273 RepID=A0A0W8G921_9ZZZZ